MDKLLSSSLRNQHYILINVPKVKRSLTELPDTIYTIRYLVLVAVFSYDSHCTDEETEAWDRVQSPDCYH